MPWVYSHPQSQHGQTVAGHSAVHSTHPTRTARPAESASQRLPRICVPRGSLKKEGRTVQGTPQYAIYFLKRLISRCKTDFSKKRNARLTKWSGKPGEITDAFFIFSTSFKNVEKTERFLNLNNKASQFSIFNLSAFCIRNMSGTIFSAGYFFTPLGEKWAVKLSGSQRYQLIGRTYQKIQRNRYG